MDTYIYSDVWPYCVCVSLWVLYMCGYVMCICVGVMCIWYVWISVSVCMSGFVYVCMHVFMYVLVCVFMN